MQRKKADELRAQWGADACDHPNLAREYDQGERTGRYVCTQCGATFNFRERAEIVASRKPEAAPDAP